MDVEFSKSINWCKIKLIFIIIIQIFLFFQNITVINHNTESNIYFIFINYLITYTSYAIITSAIYISILYNLLNKRYQESFNTYLNYGINFFIIPTTIFYLAINISYIAILIYESTHKSYLTLFSTLNAHIILTYSFVFSFQELIKLFGENESLLST